MPSTTVIMSATMTIVAPASSRRMRDRIRDRIAWLLWQ